MKPLETYTISSELIWNCHKHKTISVQLLFNHICASCTFYDKDRNKRVASIIGEEDSSLYFCLSNLDCVIFSLILSILGCINKVS